MVSALPAVFIAEAVLLGRWQQCSQSHADVRRGARDERQHAEGAQQRAPGDLTIAGNLTGCVTSGANEYRQLPVPLSLWQSNDCRR